MKLSGTLLSRCSLPMGCTSSAPSSTLNHTTCSRHLSSTCSSYLPVSPFHSPDSHLSLSPTSDVNILMMYAMCNLHDVTWGTKGDNGATKDLGSATKVQGKDGKEIIAVDLPTMQEDVDALWTASKNSLRHPPPPQKESRDAATKLADNDRNSRTNVVLAWVGTNMIMITVFTSSAFLEWVHDNVESTQSSQFNPYLTVLFYAL